MISCNLYECLELEESPRSKYFNQSLGAQYKRIELEMSCFLVKGSSGSCLVNEIPDQTAGLTVSSCTDNFDVPRLAKSPKRSTIPMISHSCIMY